ncbi:MAG: hypothetical protein K940chlam5_00036 [Candidatus Anoxychlamydiales bacterium]|nr:hypothetical protein [Candidatus Anoxychlamydiales bacterium]
MIITFDQIITNIAVGDLDLQNDLLEDVRNNKALFDDLIKYYEYLCRNLKSVHSNDFNKMFVLINILVLAKGDKAFNCFFSFINKINKLEETIFYEEFNILEVSCILYQCVKSEWTLLKKIIEHPNLEMFWKIIAVDAFCYCVAAKKNPRTNAINYLKKTLCKNIAENKECTHLVFACNFINPKEVIEEIKNAYTRFLVSDAITIDEVLDSAKMPIKKLMKELKDALPTKNDCLESLRYMFSSKGDRNVENPTKPAAKKKKKEEKNLINNEKDFLKSPVVNFCLPAIHFDLSENQLLDEIEKSDHALLLKFFDQNKPDKINEKSFSLVLSLKEKYSHIPLFWHLIDGIYMVKNMVDKSIEILFYMVEKFPDDLMTKIKYGEYLLRRGEYDKIAKFFDNKFTLQSLYPEKESFFIEDFQIFSSFMIAYFATIGKFKEADFYLNGLKQFSDNKQVISDLEEMVGDLLHRHKKKLLI